MPARNQQHDTAGGRGATTLILGCMFSGKTTELIRRLGAYASHSVVCIKHAIDTRFGDGAIVSHAGKAVPAIAVRAGSEIADVIGKHTQVVALDEAHFFDHGLPQTVVGLNERGIDVLLASLEPDSWGRPFSINQRLAELAAEVLLKTAACARCGKPADHTQRLTPVVDGNMVVDPSQYQPRCRSCWRPPVELINQADSGKRPHPEDQHLHPHHGRRQGCNLHP